MAVITTLFDVNDVVYQVSEQYGVRKGTVSAVDITERPSGVPLGYVITILYAMHLTEGAQSVTGIAESNLHDNVDDALAAYKLLAG